jgi:hypothetical protein
MTATERCAQATEPHWKTILELREEILIARMLVERTGDLLVRLQETGFVNRDEADTMFLVETRLHKVELRLLSMLD